MRVVVCGGSGVVGRRLVPAMVAAGHEVTVLSRRPGRAAAGLPAGVAVAGWDPEGLSSEWVACLVGASAVVDLSAAGAWLSGAESVAGRLAAASALVDGIAAVPPAERPGVLVAASRADVYAGPSDEAVAESAALADTTPARDARSLEQAAQEAAALDLRVVLLRMGATVSADTSGPLRGGLATTGRWLAWIAIDDLVGLLLRAITGWDLAGHVNAVAPQLSPADRRMPRLMTTDRPVWPAKALSAGFRFRHQRIEDVVAGNVARRRSASPGALELRAR